MHLAPSGRRLEDQRVVALGAITHRAHVRLGARPPHAIHPVTRETGGHRLLERRGVHHAPTPEQHVVGPVLTDLQPGRLLLDARMRDRQQLQVVTVHLRALLQQGDRLLAEWRVVVDKRNLLALQTIRTAFLLREVLDQHVGCGPVHAAQREVVLEHGTVHRLGAAIAGGDDRDLVSGGLVGHRKGDPGRQRVEHRGAGRALALQPLVALHAPVGGVTGLAFLEHDPHAVDAAVTGVEHLEVVGHAIGERRAVGRVRTGPVHQHGEELLVGLLGRRSAGGPCTGHSDRRCGESH